MPFSRFLVLCAAVLLLVDASSSTCKVKDFDATVVQLSGLVPNDMGMYDDCVHGGESYCVINLLHSNLQRYGVCVPEECASSEGLLALLATIANTTGVPPAVKNISKSLGVLVSKSGVTCGDNMVTEWDAGGVCFLIFSSILGVLIIVGTYFDIKPATAHSDDTGYVAMQEEPPAPSTKSKFFHAFSLTRTMTELLNRSPSRGYYSLDGIRAMSMLWVILAHTSNFMIFLGVENPWDFFPGYHKDNEHPLTTRWTFILGVYGAQFAVDTFFWLSGFLSALVMFRTLEKGKKFPVHLVILHRYLRLVPVYGFVCWAFTTCVGHMSSGPFWNQMVDTYTYCKTKWWTNLLFINNVYPSDYNDQCMPWTWYLANDMQFFIIGIFVVLVVHYRASIGYAFLALLITGSLTATAVIQQHYDIKAFDLVSQGMEQNKIYDKPYCRIVPYLMGMTCFFIMNKFGKPRMQLGSPFKKAFVMFLGLAIMGTVALWIWPDVKNVQNPNHPVGTWGGAWDLLYLVFSRPLWSVGCSIMCILCCTDQGGPIQLFLSWNGWDPMCKLTYSAYLCHPIIIRLFYFSRVKVIRYSDALYIQEYLAFAVLSYITATILYCAVESPFGFLSKMLTEGKKKRPRKSVVGEA